MTKIRILLTLLTIVVVSVFVWLISLYARGYHFDSDNIKIAPNGILVLKSVPDGAQVFVNGDLKTATNATIRLAPATYDIEVRKEGFLSWNKRIVIEQEVVTEATAHLFKSAPSLTAITFSGASNPTPSHDMSKIVFAVPNIANNDIHNQEKAGLWVIEMINLPVGFSRDPKRVTNVNPDNASWEWSPDDQEILLTTTSGIYLLDASKFTDQKELTNITSTTKTIYSQWEIEKNQKLNSQLRSLPDELRKILDRKASALEFSADKDMILYTASASAKIPDNLIKPVPGASTQYQERDIKEGQTYIYDIKEDRNFLIDPSNDLLISSNNSEGFTRRISWFPTSRHLVLAEPNKITIMDYDGTNRKEVYNGNYVSPHAFPAVGIDRLIILTNLGADSIVYNLYSLALK